MTDKEVFIKYWEEQGQNIEWSDYNGYSYAYVRIKDNNNTEHKGYDCVEVVAKFLDEVLIRVAYDSHVAHTTRLYDEYIDLRLGGTCDDQ